MEFEVKRGVVKTLIVQIYWCVTVDVTISFWLSRDGQEMIFIKQFIIE